MPVLGLGTWKTTPGDTGNAVRAAVLDAGYRHIDCAWGYRNEPEVGETLRDIFASGTVARDEVFVTSKLWNSFHGEDYVQKACEASLRALKLDYLDLYLMHWGVAIPPVPGLFDDSGRQVRDTEYLDKNGMLITANIPLTETWRAMENLVRAGLVKAIGVANFTAPMLLDLLSYGKMPPAMNQIELHPYLQQSELLKFCQWQNIAVTAYSPLGSPGNYGTSDLPAVLEDPVIGRIAKTHGKTPAQILVRWAVERGTIAIPKSTHPARIGENAAVFDFALSQEERADIAQLNRGLRYVDPYHWWKIPYFDRLSNDR